MSDPALQIPVLAWMGLVLTAPGVSGLCGAIRERIGLVLSAVPTVVWPGPGPHLLGLPLTSLPWWEGAVADLPGVGLGSRGKNKLPTPRRHLA